MPCSPHTFTLGLFSHFHIIGNLILVAACPVSFYTVALSATTHFTGRIYSTILLGPTETTSHGWETSATSISPRLVNQSAWPAPWLANTVFVLH